MNSDPQISFLKDLKVVAFDIDDTLVDENYYLQSRWKIVLADYKHLHNKLQTTFFKIFSEKGHKYNYHLTDTLKFLNLKFKLRNEIINKFLTTFTKDKLNPGALQLIQFLKKNKIKVGIITNGKQNYQSMRLGKINILDAMDFIYYGDRYQKPDTKLFLRCLKKFKLKDPSKFLYIGNSLEEDILSIIPLGIKTCWVTKQKTPEAIEGVLKVNSLKQLLNSFIKSYRK